jgi:hypothetical protein
MKPLIVITALGVALLAPLIAMTSARADTPIAQREPPAGAIRGPRFGPTDEIEIVTPTPTPVWLGGKEAAKPAATLLDESVRIVSPAQGQQFTGNDMITLHVVRASQRAADRDHLPPRFDQELQHSDDGRSWTPHGMWVLEGRQYPSGMEMPASAFRLAPRWRLRARLALDVTGAPVAPWTEWTEFRIRQ